jgi:hypothetical protein
MVMWNDKHVLRNDKQGASEDSLPLHFSSALLCSWLRRSALRKSQSGCAPGSGAWRRYNLVSYELLGVLRDAT